MAIDFVNLRKAFLGFWILLIFLSLFSLKFFGLKLGIEFTGGTILEFEFENERENKEEIQKKIESLNLGSFILQTIGEKGIILRTRALNEKEISQILSVLEGAKEKRIESIGPVISKELKEKTWLLTIFSILALAFYILFAFKTLTRISPGLRLFLIIIFGLVQNTIFLFGVLAILGKFFNLELSIPFLIAILTVLGYGINDTIVVLDRVRENFLSSKKEDFKEIINKSISQSLARQINTSLSTIFPLVFVAIFWEGTLRYFSLILILGIFNETLFSSTLAATLLWQKR